MKKLLLTAAALVLLAACSPPAGEVSPSPAPAETVSPEPSAEPAPSPSVQPSTGGVFTDWSKLDSASSGPLFTRYYPGRTDRLLPVTGGYGGDLMPFPGAELTLDLGFEWSTQSLYGLATPDGTVVCDPVYESAYQMDGYLFLIRTRYTGEVNEYGEPDSPRMATIAASDGSWVLEGEYTTYFTLDDGRLLLLDEAEQFWFCDKTGALERSPLDVRPSELWGPWWRELGPFQNGIACMPVYDEDGYGQRMVLADALTGETKELEGLDYVSIVHRDGLYEALDSESKLYGYLDRTGEWVIPPQFRYASSFEEGYARVQTSIGENAVIDRTGTVLRTFQGETLWHCKGYYLDCSWSWDDQIATVYGVYDEGFQPLPDHPLQGAELSTSYAAPAVQEGDLWTIWDGDTAYTVDAGPDAQLNSFEDGRAGFFYNRDQAVWYAVYDCVEQRWVIPRETYGYVFQDGSGADTVYFVQADYAARDGDLLDHDGNFIAAADGFDGVEQDLLKVRRGLYCGWMDRSGRWVFRWPVQSNND